MKEPSKPIQIALTPEQQAMILRMSGQHAQMLELTPEADAPGSGSGQSLRFQWRLSSASGIPRQRWVREEPDSKAES